MITVYTVETTGLYQFNRPASDPNQPRMVSMAAVLLSPKFEQRGYFELIVRHDGSASSATAQAVHGVSEKDRERFGVDPRFPVAGLFRFSRLSKEIATFNLDFNSAVIATECYHLMADMTDWTRGGLKRTSIQDEAATRWNSGKRFNLQEAHEVACGFSYVRPERDKHVHDLRAAIRILEELRRT